MNQVIHHTAQHRYPNQHSPFSQNYSIMSKYLIGESKKKQQHQQHQQQQQLKFDRI